MTMSFRRLDFEDLARLNSATKYPSIPTYHALGDKGRLTAELNVRLSGDVHVTEKIDGTNSRIILSPNPDDGLIIGSREELLHYTDDLIFNPSQSIVSTLYSILQRGAEPAVLAHDSLLVVVYGEVYGGKVTAGSKQYASKMTTGFRVFDIALIAPEVLATSTERIAAWRDSGGQEFVPVDVLAFSVRKAGLELVPEIVATAPPVDLQETLAWLEGIAPVSLASLDDSAGRQAEGVVVRSADRSSIAKLRFEDYRRTFRGKR